MDNQRNHHKLSVLSHHQVSNNNKNQQQDNNNSTEDLNSSSRVKSARANKVLTNMKFFIESKPITKKSEDKRQQQMPNFNSDSIDTFNSQSLMNIENNYGSGYGTVNLPYSSLGSASKKDKQKAEKKIKDLSSFDSFLSKSTYFQPKCKAINDYLLPYSNVRPFTPKENQNSIEKKNSSEELKDASLGSTLNPLTTDALNKFQRVKVKTEEMPIDRIETVRPKTKTWPEIATMEYENNKLLSNANQSNVYEK